MTRHGKHNYNPEFQLEAALLIVDQNYSIREAAEAMTTDQRKPENQNVS